MVDWDRGEYEDTASELAPAAEHVIAQAQIEPGQTVLDIGTGTGNAALFARRAGAKVTAVDPSPRLLAVAQERVGEGTFVQAKAEELPFEDRAFDRVVSIFAVIFSEDPARAAGEIVRVTRGRALITSWEQSGKARDFLETLGRATSQAAGTSRDRFPWHEPDSVVELFGDRASVTCERASIAFQAPTAEAYMQRFESLHPAGILFRDVLTRNGNYDEVRARALATLGDEEPMTISSNYFVFTIEPRAAG